MSWRRNLKREAKTAWKRLEDVLSYDLIDDPYKGSPVPVSSPVFPSLLPFPWLTSSAGVQTTPLHRQDVVPAARMLRRAMSKHPPEVLKQSVKQICLFRALQLEGEPVGGTCDVSGGVLYLTYAPDIEGGEEQIEVAFHHELAHLLLNNYRSHWAEEAWFALNPIAFNYGTGGLDAIKSGTASGEFSEALGLKGFLSQYAASPPDEDFCSIVEGLFGCRPGFWEVADAFPNINSKAKLAMTFFRHLHEDYSEARFRSYDSHQRA